MTSSKRHRRFVVFNVRLIVVLTTLIVIHWIYSMNIDAAFGWIYKTKAPSVADRTRTVSAEYKEDNGLTESMSYTEVRYAVIRPRDYSLMTGKRFVYLISSPTKGSIKGLTETKERDVIWLTFADRSGDIFAPNTSNFGGRNALLQHAVKLAAQMKDGGYEYYITMDDDVLLSLKSDGQVNWKPWNEMATNPFQRFEEFLMHYRPIVGYVRYKDNARQFVNLSYPTNLNWDFDDCFNAFHKDALSFLIPYDLHMEYESWFYAGWITRQLIAMLYHSYRMQCNSLNATNLISGREISKDRYKQNYDYKKPRDYVLSALREENGTNSNLFLADAVLQGYALLKYPGDLQPGPDIQLPGKPKRKGNHSFKVTQEFIRKHWDLGHPMIKKKLMWLQKPEVRKVLGLDKRRIQPFVPDTVYCTAPKEFRLIARKTKW